MKKILLIINPHSPKLTTIDFACSIANAAQANLTGLFIENIYAGPVMVGFPEGALYIETETDQQQLKAETDLAIRVFQDECNMRNICSEVDVDKGEPIQEIIRESRFTDLIICDPDLAFDEFSEQMPSHFVKEILAKAECPVMLAPTSFNSIKEIYFCYDGSASSVFATKQFTYLFPEFRDKKVTLLEVNGNENVEFGDSERDMMNWLKAHYNTVNYRLLSGDAKDELVTYFFMQQDKLVVMGAYGRSGLSNFFKKSNAENIIRVIDLPLFITHH